MVDETQTHRKPAIRGGVPFSDAVVEAIVAAAGGTAPADPTAIAAVEAAVGLYARCLAGATVTDATGAVTPPVLALIGRDLIRRGESVHLVEVRGNRVTLIPAGSWDVRGPWREESWFYRLDLFGPSGNITRFVPAPAVVHARYAVDPARPWLGISPLGWARATGTLAANLEQRLGEEAGGTVAHILPIPQDPGGEDSPLSDLKTDIKSAKGGTVLTETTAAAWGEGPAGAPQRDWRASRIGADPPETLPVLRRDVFEAVLGACGVPVSLFTDADGTSQRESFRRFLTTAVIPLGDLIGDELAGKLETPIRLDFTHLYAHDLAGRAGAFGKLVAGGVTVDKALVIAGL